MPNIVIAIMMDAAELYMSLISNLKSLFLLCCYALLEFPFRVANVFCLLSTIMFMFIFENTLHNINVKSLLKYKHTIVQIIHVVYIYELQPVSAVTRFEGKT